jgi:hypothetical protein
MLFQTSVACSPISVAIEPSGLIPTMPALNRYSLPAGTVIASSYSATGEAMVEERTGWFMLIGSGFSPRLWRRWMMAGDNSWGTVSSRCRRTGDTGAVGKPESFKEVEQRGTPWNMPAGSESSEWR